MTVAGISMVRNEADILEASIRHMLNQGVDFLLIADHGSTDGTREILESFDEVTWMANDDSDYRQVAWMNELAMLAHSRGADWIVPWDADEWWTATNGDTLADFLDGLPSVVQICHATLWHHRDWDHKYVRPEGLPKVAYRWAPDARLLIGNHGVEFDKPAVLGPSFSLEIRHLQYRSAEHFIAKVRDHNSTLTPEMRARGEGAHKSQYEHLTDEQLLAVYAEMCAQPTVFDPIPATTTRLVDAAMQGAAMTFEPLFTIVTVSIPERHELLTRAMESVRNQTYGPVPHLIRVDEPGATLSTQHVAMQRNALLPAIQTPWMAVLDDDDMFEPTYLERCAQAIAEHPDASVVYTYCHGHAHAEGPFDAERLERENYIDGEAVIRVADLGYPGDGSYDGGYPEVANQVEDWEVWKRLSRRGDEFVCIPERLRYHGRAGRNITG